MTIRAMTPRGIPVVETNVEIADFAVASGNAVLVTVGLGSCVALALHDPATGTSGLAHILLPNVGTGPASIRAAKYADTAVPMLAEEMRRHGARRKLVAKLAGGARMFAALLPSGINMGERNIEATRAALERLGIPIVGEDVGGEYGRSVRLVAATGAMTVRSLVGGNREL
jgi:chemotaxis protein CheD